MIAGLFQATLLACDSGERSTMEAVQEAAPPSAAVGARTAGGASDAAGPAVSPNEVSSATPKADAIVESAMIVRTGQASIEVDSLELSVIELRRLVQQTGGFIANTSMQSGKEQLRQAILEAKVPAARFDDLSGGLGPIGRVEFVNVSAEDVGEEFVDLTARATNARRLEERLIDLLGTRTGRLQDVLAVERELARVREEIERLDGRLRYLKSRSSLSTLSITLHEPLPLVAGHPGASVIAEAFRQAWRNFVGLSAGLIAAMGIVVPVAGVVGGGVLLVKRIKR
ncbi:MAG: DUF4349 domain-containing protein [Gemmatimonadota bacterium]|nr:DUF4349 domain-containing protein [Gemmatimonadota bacterium]